MTPPIHVRVARRWRLVRIASQAGVGAVAASLVAWAGGAPPWLHLAAILAGAAVAAAWPARLDERRALRWVAERVGLAYETAWEHADAPARGATPSDPAAALRAAVAVQGRLSIRDLRTPPSPPWWVPLATVALGLWVWAALVAGGAVGTPFGAPGAAPRPPGTVAPADAESEPTPPDEGVEVAPFAPDAEGDDAVGAEGAGAGGAAGGAGADGAASERDVLDRFLDNLRERPAEAEEERRRAAEARADEPVDEAAEERAPGEQLGEPAREGGERSEGEGGEGEGDPDGAEGEEAGAGDEAAAEGDGEGERSEGGEEGEAQGPSPEAGGEEGAGEGEGGEAGALEGGEEEGEAGVGVSAPGEGDDPSGPAVADPESLPSLLGPGPEQTVGGAQLPGVAPAGEVFPAGAAGAAFQRAVEQALNEGEVPVPYQDVIRNYFR